MRHDLPRIAVMLATFNGARWLDEQLDTILGQADVAVTLFASDDFSTDQSRSILQKRAALDDRVHLVHTRERCGHAAANFYHLIDCVQLDNFDYFAFADQDDIWLDGRLARQVEILKRGHTEAVSSNVIAFWPDGSRSMVEKALPQRRYDYLFESPGPGCSFLLSRQAYALVRDQLSNRNSAARRARYHDWLIYALVRGCDLAWFIDPEPALLYRQHDANEVGANRGFKAASKRLSRIMKGTFHAEVGDVYQAVSQARQGRCLPALPAISCGTILHEGRRKSVHRLLFALIFPRGVRLTSSLDHAQ